MRASRHAAILVTVTLAGIALAGQNQQAPSSQTGRQGASGGQSRTDQEVVNLRGQESEMTRAAQVFELDLAGLEARSKALQAQIALLRKAAGPQPADGGQLEEFTRELSRLALDKAQRQAQRQTLRKHLEELQKQLAQVAPSAPRTDQEAVNLRGQKSELARRAQVLESDLAGLDARRKALQEQITLSRANADKGSVGGGPFEEFTKELNRLAVDKAGTEAQLQTVRRQLEEVQKQLAQIAPSAPRTDQEAVNLGGQKSELTRRAQALELDLAGIDARHKALQEQIAGKGSASSRQLGEFTKELGRLLVDKAGKEAQVQTVRRQLEEVQKQLAQALASGR